jgi:hypothetical protein
MDPRVRAGIFHGESGGDYNALLGFSNRPGGQFSNVRLTDMTVDDAIRFSDPSGPYAQYAKGKVGRVATPMGAYQVVGTTLRAAKKALGLSGNERMTPELQDRIGQHIIDTQGTAAWTGYKGPRQPTPNATVEQAAYDPRRDTPSTGQPVGSKLPGQPNQYSLQVRHPDNPMVGTGGAAATEPLPPFPGYGKERQKTAGEVLGEGIARMGAQPEPATSLPGIAKPQVTMSSLPSMPMIDPQQTETRRQMLAMLMQRLNSGGLV